MAENDEHSYQDSPKKAFKECSMMQKTLQAERKSKKTEQADFIDLNKKQHYMPRRYDVSEMIKDQQTIHELLEEDETKIAMIDNRMAELDNEYIKKVHLR